MIVHLDDVTDVVGCQHTVFLCEEGDLTTFLFDFVKAVVFCCYPHVIIIILIDCRYVIAAQRIFLAVFMIVDDRLFLRVINKEARHVGSDGYSVVIQCF